MNIVDCALKMEVGARMNYETLAATTGIPELKQLFTLLAEAEQEHHDALETLKSSVDPAKAEFRALQEAACVFHSLVGKRDSMDELNEDTDMYQQVVKEEQDAISFYEELAVQAGGRGVGEILLKIAAEERKHLSIVENIYAFVESPKNFLAWGEFSNLKEY